MSAVGLNDVNCTIYDRMEFRHHETCVKSNKTTDDFRTMPQREAQGINARPRIQSLDPPDSRKRNGEPDRSSVQRRERQIRR